MLFKKSKYLACFVSFTLCVVLMLVCIQCKKLQTRKQVIYVSKDGNDAWSGTLPKPNAEGTDGPLLTLAKASSSLMQGGACFVREGIYRETLKPMHSGTVSERITFSNYKNEHVVISGTDLLKGKWENNSEFIYKMPFNAKSANMMVFVQETLLEEASWPNSSGDLLKPNYGKVEGGTFRTMRAEDLPDNINLTGATLYGYFGKEWALQTMKISSYNSKTKTVTFLEPTRRKNYYGGVDKWMQNYGPRDGNRYYIKGHYNLMDTNGEWYYNDELNILYVYADNKFPIKSQKIAVKSRDYAIDISGVSNVDIFGVSILGAGIISNSETKNCRLKNIKGQYVEPGVFINGYNNELSNSEFAYCKKGIVNVLGTGNRIINNYIHDGNYTGSWGEILNTKGDGHLVSHNTVARSGGGCIGPGGRNMRFQYNEVKDAGLIRHDIGGFYIANNDGGGTVISYNKVYNIYGIGIYLDNSTSNYTIHHNVVWNCGWQYVLSTPPASFLDIGAYDAIRLNTPSNFNLVYNNTAYGGPGLGYWGRNFERDMYGGHIINNIFPEGWRVTNSATVGPNLGNTDSPSFENPEAYRFTLKSNSEAIDRAHTLKGVTQVFTGESADYGAYEFGRTPWKAGHDFNTEPHLEFYEFKTDFMNLVQNNGFEDGFKSWKLLNPKLIKLINQDSWGVETAETRMQSHAVMLKGNSAEISQRISGLKANNHYTVSAWIKTKKEGIGLITVQFGDFNKNIEIKNTKGWEFVKFDFYAKESIKSLHLSLQNTGESQSEVFFDDVGLIRMFK